MSGQSTANHLKNVSSPEGFGGEGGIDGIWGDVGDGCSETNGVCFWMIPFVNTSCCFSELTSDSIFLILLLSTRKTIIETRRAINSIVNND